MKKKVTKIQCDFCDAEIEKSTPAVQATVELQGTMPPLSVEIRTSWADGKRFTADICRNCVFAAATAAAPKANAVSETVDL